MVPKMILAMVLALAPSMGVGADKSGALYDTVLAQDQRLFGAFNTCDLKTLGEMVTDDLQFFHDQDGLSVGRAPFLQAVSNNVCGKFTRSLEPGSVEVWRMPNYGAIEIGVHRFHHLDGSPDGLGKFMIVWKESGGHWVMAQSFSYDHSEAGR